MKILITGTTGFLGRSLKEHFEKNHTVVEWNRNDINISSFIMVHHPDIMIHCAGEIYKPEFMFSTNVDMVSCILNTIRDQSPHTKLIQIGSSSEYGPVARPTAETDPINPQNLYEATKGSATLLCQAYARQYGLDTCVARIYSGYGPYERPHRLFPKLHRAFFYNEPMSLFAGTHDFIYIDDFVRGIDILINSIWPKGEIVNLGSGVQYSNKEVLEVWEKVTGRVAPVTYEDRFLKAHDTKFWCCDTSYARMQYRFQTEYTLEDGVRDMIRKLNDN